MGTDMKSARRWNRALLSIYYFGRKNLEPLAGARPPPGILPVDEAVSELESAGRDALGSVRLALTDLVRTRNQLIPKSRADQKVEELIIRLSITYSNLLGTHLRAQDFARRMADLSGRVPGAMDETAYVRALNFLAEQDPRPRPPGVLPPRMVSYEVARRG
jgi:hypothetical protein